MSADTEIMKASVMWYGVGALRRLRQLTRAQVQEVANAAGELSAERPLWCFPKPEFDLPHFDTKQTGCQVIAAMVFSVWVLCGENETAAAPLLKAWPIREAVMLAGASK